MKITLSFDALSPEEISQARRVLNSIDLHGAARELPRGESPLGQVSPKGATSAPPPPSDNPAPPPPPSDNPAPPPPPPAADNPAPPPPPTTENTAPPPPAPAPTTAEVDSLGHKWDERFHVLRKKTGERPKLKDGSWARRRGVKKADVIAALGEPPGAAPGPNGTTVAPVAPPPPPPAPAVVGAEGGAPLPSPAANGGAVTWNDVVVAFVDRGPPGPDQPAKYSQDQMREVLRAQNIDPDTLFKTPINWGPAVQVLNQSCPL